MNAHRCWSFRLAALAILACGVQSCGDTGTGPTPAATPANISALAADTQVTAAGSDVTTPPAVVVQDSSRQAIAGVVVTFTVTAGGGSLSGGQATTDARGVATAHTWTLGTTLGVNTVTAAVAALPPVTFTAVAIAGPARIISKQVGDGQSATVGTSVATAPTVLVSDAFGNPAAGAVVTFAVASGAGGLTSAQATADSVGIATSATWTLGTVAGANTLTATVAGVTPAVFTATGIAGPAAGVATYAGSGQSATVNTAVAITPAVRVADVYGNGVAGAIVAFAVGMGGGNLAGAATASATTDSLGVAVAGSWTLGIVIGTNTLDASVTGLPTPATFVATGRAGPAATITKAAGDNQSAPLRAPVTTVPSVRLSDQYGNVVSGASVTFVASGGGAVSGGTASTDTNGIAAVAAWNLGQVVGTNLLSATTSGLPAVTFAATAYDPCSTLPLFAFGDTVTGMLSSYDCLSNRRHTDMFATSVASQLSVRLDMLSTSPFLSILDGSGLPVFTVGFCDIDYCETTATVSVLLAPGSYTVSASGYDLGPYSLTSAVIPEDVGGCQIPFVTRGVSTSQRIEDTDCVDEFRSSPYYYDHYALHLSAGQSITITMSSTAFDTYLVLSGPGGVYVENHAFGGTRDSQIAFTASQDGEYAVQATTYLGGATGSYTLAIQ